MAVGFHERLVPGIYSVLCPKIQGCCRLESRLLLFRFFFPMLNIGICRNASFLLFSMVFHFLGF